MEHMASRQGETERELAALRMTVAPRTPLPDPRAQATQLIPKMTAHDDVETFLQMFEAITAWEVWPRVGADAHAVQRICDHFHWPGLEAEVKRFCQACPTCQRTSPRTPPPSPLIPLPIIEVSLYRHGKDWPCHLRGTVGPPQRGPTVPHEYSKALGQNRGPACSPRSVTSRGCGHGPPPLGLPKIRAATPGQSVHVFSPQPGRTHVLKQDIHTAPGVIIWQQPYHVPEARQHAIEEEVQEMLRLGTIEPSRSPWSISIIMVPKPNGIFHFCNDFRRLNEVSEFNGYPMPRVDELLDHLGRARYISTLYLTKGYWQVPLNRAGQAEDGVLDPQWPLAIPGPTLRPAWGSRHLPVVN
ncbi:uncharacterized protein LOC113061300 [Carassius auratus]|uniref:Gypsy retrotransposon integrase-like protein 1 n=1 Tax=Carassius auratus TaxID=7957 RepID=A0A6P6LNJ6_CARAU|nr:uncharacterized protein LOC113061300 [Carassius auratus]